MPEKIDEKNKIEKPKLVTIQELIEYVDSKKNDGIWNKTKAVVKITSTALRVNKYISLCIIFSFPLLLVFFAAIFPTKVEIPHSSKLNSIEGIFDYEEPAKKSDKKFTSYVINNQKFNCAQVIRMYPFDNCPITLEVKLFKGSNVKAKWFNHSMFFIKIPLLVEMVFNDDIKVMGVEDTNALMLKIHKKNTKSFMTLAPVILIGYILMILLLIYTLYKYQASKPYINHKP
jgi:hypothetical protein